MSELEKDYKNINDNWDYGIRSSGFFGRAAGYLFRILFRSQADLNASFVRILNGQRVELERLTRLNSFLRWRVYVDKDAAVDPGGSGFDYYGFEKVFRPAGVVAERLARYVEFFRGKNGVIDVGCGRGEFLELLREKGIEAIGVDSNADMVGNCRAKGLEAINSEFKEYLSSLQDGSVEGVFSAQFIEHIHFDELDGFIKLSFKKLKPGGVFVAETINPYHLAAFRAFYVDPTHVKPLYPEVVEFICRSAGFKKVKTIFVPPFGAAEQGLEEPWDYTDYALVAEKVEVRK